MNLKDGGARMDYYANTDYVTFSSKYDRYAISAYMMSSEEAQDFKLCIYFNIKKNIYLEHQTTYFRAMTSQDEGKIPNVQSKETLKTSLK